MTPRAVAALALAVSLVPFASAQDLTRTSLDDNPPPTAPERILITGRAMDLLGEASTSSQGSIGAGGGAVDPLVPLRARPARGRVHLSRP